MNKTSIAEKSSGAKAKSEIKNTPFPASFQDAIYLTIHHSSKSAKEIAQDIGVSYSQLCNTCNPRQPFKFSSRHLIPLMRSAGPDVILNYLAREFDSSFIRHPTKAKPRGMLIDGIKTQEAWHAIAKNLHRYFASEDNARNQILDEIKQMADSLIDVAAQLKATAQHIQKEKVKHKEI